MARLPPEIPLLHILPRLPAKSVVRFTSVSKEWRSFITTPLFVKMHLHHVTTNSRHHPDHHKLLLLHRGEPFKFSTIDCEALEDSLSNVHRPLPFEFGVSMRMVASCHGIVCAALFSNSDRRYFSDLVLWNPLTGDHRMISKLVSSQQEYYDVWRGAFVLYYTCSDDDYKMVRMISSCDAYIYSLKSDSWRQLKPTCIDDVKRKFNWYSTRMLKSVVLNDKLYILRHAGIRHSVMIFDTKTEKSKGIGLPCFTSNLCSITVLKGCIHLFSVSLGLKTELWRLDGDDDHWTEVGSSCYHLKKNWYADPEQLHNIVISANWLVSSIKSSSLCESDRKMLASKVMCSYAHFALHTVTGPIVDLIATLVSPNQYIK